MNAASSPQQPPVSTLLALQSLLYILAVALFLMAFTVQPFRIPSESMEPTLLVGDFLLVNKEAVAPGAGGILPASGISRRDIIVFHDPVDPKLHLVKRVVGMPGDRLHLHDNKVYINGSPLAESYAVYRPSAPDAFRDNFPRMQNADPSVDAQWWIRMRGLLDHGDLIVPADNYFVMGDNRNDSEDSRYWGFVPRELIVGKPLLVYFSLRETNDEDADDDAPKPAPAVKTNRNPFAFARWGRTFQVVR
ncbi:signal peptidase I [Granulicella rosea]|uniref:Signal peptidase I n=1 Tax=Granulicella rosea TaxID=474952 RepID=A0A239K7A5_9BACT|nr:signal peptidase I [Granulicella rosea]SNT14346.1 signal peptidase I [Granulicella rosea]